jgi:hypothetical protein
VPLKAAVESRERQKVRGNAPRSKGTKGGALEVQRFEVGASREPFTARSAPPLPHSHSLHTALHTEADDDASAEHKHTHARMSGGNTHRTAMHAKLIRGVGAPSGGRGAETVELAIADAEQ